MPTRRGPGRPRSVGRPRKIDDQYLAVSEGFHRPTTRAGTLVALRKEWEPFLQARGVDSDEVTVHDFIAWEQELVAKGFTRTRKVYNARVRGFYILMGSAFPDSRWSKLAAEIRAHKSPKTIGKKNPHQPLPLALLPKILEAAKAVKQYRPGGLVPYEYSEAYAVAATFLYSGGRVQWYGITDEQVRGALKKKYIELFVKEGEEVHVPIHDRLLEVWAEHFRQRDFDGPFFFRLGKNPYTYQEGSKEWREDALAAALNGANGNRIFNARGDGHRANYDCVERRLREMYGLDEEITVHRFRKSVGSYMEAYGYTEAERRLQLHHGAATITQEYSVAAVLELQKKLSVIDLGSAEWVAAHDPPTNLFTGGNGHDDANVLIIEDLRKQLTAERERNDRLERKIDQLLERSTPKVVA